MILPASHKGFDIRAAYHYPTFFSQCSILVRGKQGKDFCGERSRLENHIGPARLTPSEADHNERIRFAMATSTLKQSVYFIQSGDDGPIKIGIASDPATRLRQMQTGSPERLTLLGEASGGAVYEKFLHRHLSAHHARSEWFRPAPEVIALAGCCNINPLQRALGVGRREAIAYSFHAVLAAKQAFAKEAM